MLRVGFGKPGIITDNPDSHHPEHGDSYRINDWYWVGKNEYEEINGFQKFNKKPDFSDPLAKCMFEDMYKAQLEYYLKLSGGCELWQKNFTQDFEEYHRHVIILGEKTVIRWSWFDAYVLKYLYYPILWYKRLRS